MYLTPTKLITVFAFSLKSGPECTKSVCDN